jgi:hypothetical protein
MSFTRRQDGAIKDRLSSAALALLLQALFIAAFLHAFSQAPPARQLAHEITFFLPRLSHTPSSPSQIDATTPPVAAPFIVTPPRPDVTTAPLVSPQTLQNFGQALSGCAPETYANLTPEQRAHCARPSDGVAIQGAPGLTGMPSHVKDEALWAAGLTERNTPARVPCTYLEDQALGPTKVGHNLMVDPICAFNELQHELGH